jgi:hypothetical protein
VRLFNLRHSWNYPSNNYGQIFGIADSGVETFRGTPSKSLAREICQNSIDANLQNGKPTSIDFMTFEIAPNDIPDFQELTYAFTKALDFWSKQKSDKAKTFFKKAITVSKQSKIVCLRISDHNTTGLTGSREEYNSSWCNLTKSTGASDKSGTNGGSFGIGKFAPYACSAFRTVFYSTADLDGLVAYQGVSRLTSFKNKKGETTQGIGFYGNDKNVPVQEQISLDPSYQRSAEDYGTDIFVLGFTGEGDWKEKMVASILDGFLYAVYNNALVVNVDGTVISRDTLPDLMVSHKSYFKEYADEYYTVLTDDIVAHTFEKEITDDSTLVGKVTLRLMIMPEFHRRVAMVRQTGMKIKDKGNINGLIPFAGILYIEGNKLNSYLRGLENPQHLEWEIERAENKTKARNLLACLTKFIKKCLDELKDDDSEEALDPSVGEYLSAEQDEFSKQDNVAENLNDTIKSIKVKVNTVTSKPTGTQSSGDGTTEVDDPEGEIVVTDIPGEGGCDGDSSGSHGDGSGGHGTGTGGGDTPVDHRKSLFGIAPAKVRVLCTNKLAGQYTVSFMPAVSAENGILDLFMSAESQNYDASIVSATCDACPGIKFSKNRIEGLSFTEKVPVLIKVVLDYHDYCSMEVKAYGNKV